MYEGIKLGIALPNKETTFPSAFVDSFFCLTKPLDSVYLKVLSQGPIDTIRNELAQLALLHKCTHIWYCDTDQVYPQDTLIRLLAHDLPIVVAKVHRRMPPYDPILRRQVNGEWVDVPEDEWAINPGAMTDKALSGLVEVDGTGFGCVLLKTEVLEKIEKPWFKFVVENGTVIGEDFYFWNKVKEAGYKIFVDCGIKIGHLATFTITEESYFAYKCAQVWDRNESSDKGVGAPGPPSQFLKNLKGVEKEK